MVEGDADQNKSSRGLTPEETPQESLTKDVSVVPNENQTSFFDKVLMEQPQSLPPQHFKQQDNIDLPQTNNQQHFDNKERSMVLQDESHYIISSIDDFFQMLKSNLEQDNKIVINGKTYEFNLEEISTYRQHQHRFQHQPCSLASMVTTTSLEIKKEESKRDKQQQKPRIFPDQQLSEAHDSNNQQLTDFGNIDMKKIEKMCNFEVDDLLIINDLDDTQLETIKPMPSKSYNTQFPEENKDYLNGKEQNSTQKNFISKDNVRIEETDFISNPGHKKEAYPEVKGIKDKQMQTFQLKRHNSEQPILNHFIVSQNYSKASQCFAQDQAQSQQLLIGQLQQQLSDKIQEVSKLKETLNRLSNSLSRIYATPQLLSKDIDDKELLRILSQKFVAQAKLHLAFLFSSPLIVKYRDDVTGELKSQTIQQIDYNKEFCGVFDSLKETGNQIRYRKIPATLDNLRKTFTESPIALHFSGHGIENNKKNFGRDSIILKDEGNFLIFEDSEGCAQFMSEKKLHELLEASGTKLEFVFVASCYSQFAGEIFHNAGAKHVICVRKGFQISDEASIIFSKNFYHALFSQTVTVCQAFEIAKAALRAEKGKGLAEESRKFVLLKDSDESERQMQISSPMMPFSYFGLRPKKHKCTIFGPFNQGMIEDVGQEPLFRLDTSKVEDFVGRRKEMQDIISEIFANRFVTIKGIPGIGKTTIAKAIVQFLDERQAFKDGIILLSLRGLDQANMVLTRLQLIFRKHLPKETKEEKAIETFQQIQDKIVCFMKDKEILLCLDNAEDTLRKEGNLFREILQNILVSCPRVRMLLTSRYPIGQFADISERIYTLKELNPHYAIELLMKKAMRPIKESEIQDLLKNAHPTRILHSNPVCYQKDVKRLDEHHLSVLLGGHPHAISLAAPLLQDKSLKELYTLLNSPDIIEWLQIEGIEGTPLASLKVSLDTSIQHMTEQEPQAIKLFCFIGLFPGGCTEEDLNALQNEGWVMYAEKLLRASLLVKKNGSNNEIRYTLFPFMNQYAVQLMDEETKIQEHKNICIYLANICKSMLKLSQQEIINRLVSFETNIWACIYRIVDKQTSHGHESLSRSKSPCQTIRDSQNTCTNQHDGTTLIKSHDDSSQGGHSSDKFIDPSGDDYYETILFQRRQNDHRSRSEKAVNKRCLIKQDQEQTHQPKDKDEEAAKNQASNQCQEDYYSDYKKKEKSQCNHEDSQKGNFYTICHQNKESSSAQPQSLTQSYYEDPANSNVKYSNQNQVQEQQFIPHSGGNGVYPTNQIALQLSDDLKQYQMNNKSQVNNIKRLSLIGIDERKQIQVLESDDIFNQNQQNDNNESLGFNRTSSNECSTPMSLQTTINANLKKDFLNSQKFESVPNEPNQILQNFVYQNVDDDNQSIIQYQNEQFETSSMDSLQSHLLNMTLMSNQLNDSCFFNIQRKPEGRRKSVYSIAKQSQKLDEIDETFEEENSCMMMSENGDLSNQNPTNSEQTKNTQSELENDQPSMIKRLSSKKYQEDEQLQKQQSQSRFYEIQKSQNDDHLTNGNDNPSGIDEPIKHTTKIKKSKKNAHKKVTIQENIPQTNNNATNKGGHQLHYHSYYHPNTETSSLMTLTAEGSLLVYYITNLVILSKYDEALKTIENFGLRISSDQLCIANIKKLQAYIMSVTTQDYTQIQQKYEEAQKMFKQLKISHGQALCSCAIGLMMYSHPQGFVNRKVNENKVFDKAMKRFEQAATLYNKSNHYVGEAFCNKLLAFIKKKLGESYIDNQRKQKTLMLKDRALQQEGRSSFIHLNEGKIEVSLFLEVIQYHQQESNHSSNSLYSLKNMKGKEHGDTSISTFRVPKRESLLREEQKQSTNIQNVKRLVPSQFARDSKQDPRHTNTSRLSAAQHSIYNHEFDKLKLQLEHSKKSQVTHDTNDFQEIPSPSKVTKKYEHYKKREPPKTSKYYKKQDLTQLKNNMDLSRTEDQNTLILSSDNEQLTNSSYMQPSSKKTELKTIKEVKKKPADLMEQAMHQIQKYKKKRNEKIEKAKNSQLSASFIQPRNSQLEGVANQLRVREKLNNYQTLSSNLSKIIEKKKIPADFNEPSSLRLKKKKKTAQDLTTSDMIFEPAQDMEFTNSDDEIAQKSQRASFNGKGISTSLRGKIKKSQTLMNLPSINSSRRNSGRVSGRPGTGLNHDKQLSTVKRVTMGTQASKKKPGNQLTIKKPSDTSLIVPKPSNTEIVQSSRQASPNAQQQKKATVQAQQLQQTTTTTTNVKGKEVMELNITTTTTVKIELPKQTNANNQPVIVVEEVDQNQSRNE